MVYQRVLMDSATPLEQSSFIKISVLLWIKPITTQRKLHKAVEQKALCLSSLYERVDIFKQERTETKDQRSRKRNNSDFVEKGVERIREAFNESRHWSITKLSKN